MNIWIVNHYAMPPKYEVRIRNNAMAKYLQKKGHDVKIISASTIHNTNINLMENSKLRILEKTYEGLNFVHIKTSYYQGNGLKRIINHLQFPIRFLLNYKKISNKPDLMICNLGIPFTIIPFIISRKTNSKFIFEVRDLWPESFVAYGIVSRKNPLTRLLYACEKWIYKRSDKLIFTMEGGKDYIIKNGWDTDQGGPIDISKVHHINNGVDVEVFNYNKDKYHFEDEDLDNESIFKVVYAGSIRKVNKLDILIEVAKELRNEDIVILVWGDGDERDALTRKCKEENVSNIIFKGFADKKYIPSILSRADVNLVHGGYTSIMEYGMSANKMFDYIAAQKPILSDLKTNYDIIKKYKLGLVIDNQNYKDICNGILKLRNNSNENRENINQNLRKALKEFSYEELANRLINLLNLEE